MGSLWGVNASVARVHALLMVSEEPLCLDDISERLNISRGNTSMCLKELRGWGVVKKLSIPDSRKEYYVSEEDVWKMFIRIMRERKKREFDPALEAIRGIIAEHSTEKKESISDRRLRQMAELMNTMDSLSTNFLSNEDEAKSLLTLISGMAKQRQ